ncbi:MAG: translation initiation factor IF-2 [Magnetococcales bacterium]|nr:translation initiation factor IF-2 [Magnetococcales bacterium]
MSDTKDSADEANKLKLNAPHRIVLKKTVEEGSIKQSFAHGRTKNVVVEVRRKRTFVKPGSESPSDEGDRDDAGDNARLESDDRQRVHHVLKPMSPEERLAFEAEQETLRRQQEEEAQSLREAEALAAVRAAEAATRAAEEAARKAAREAEEAVQKAAQEATQKATQKAAQEAEEAARREAEAKLAPPPASPPRPEPTAPPAAVSVPTALPTPPPAAPAAKAPPAEVEMKLVAQPPQPRDKVSPAGRGEGDQRMRSGVRVDSVAPAAPAAVAAAPAAEGATEEEGDGKGGPRKKTTRLKREDLARKKAEDLMAQRIAQIEQLREQKRLDDQRKQEAPAPVAAAAAPAATAAAADDKDDKDKGRKTIRAKGAGRKDEEDGDGRGGRGGRGVLELKGGRGGSSRFAKGGRRHEPQPPPGPVVREVIVPDTITVGELANRMAVKSSEVIKYLFKQGMMVTINQVIDQDTAVLLVEEMGHKAKPVSEAAMIEAELADSTEFPLMDVDRPPVVTVMGHVDHGKTSLLDAIRKTDVVSREFGGITQHIGAYQVMLTNGERITFLDTPGHAAFTAMRARGAQVTDLVVLVVAADDGVMPQTVEAINHAKAAGVPLIVAINKMDRMGANPDRVMQQLTEHGLVPEDWGGETIFVKVSAHTGEGIETLKEMILLQSEILNLKANPGLRARGRIVEAKLDKGRGAVATCLVQNGTLRPGDIFVVGAEWGKIRGLLDDKGESVKEAPPAFPVEIIGLSGVPHAGDELVVTPDERRAREIATFRLNKMKEQDQVKQAATHTANLGDIFDQIKQGALEEVKVVLKADVQGSVEAVADALHKITHDQVRVAVIHTGVGGINESDVMLAVASNAIVLGFNVRADAKSRVLAKREGVDLRFYNIIYDLVDDITKALEGRLAPTVKETVLGHLQVRDVFRISKVGNIAGCIVSDGIIRREAKCRLLRNQVVIFDGALSSLKHFKDDLKEAREGMECGVGLERFHDIKTGDVLEAYIHEEVRQTIG